jgi:pheromone shutdown protein TraB
MTNSGFPQKTYNTDVHILSNEEQTILLIGTAHVSKLSVELVAEVITSEHPDAVCLELDEKRYKALSEEERWQKLDLKSIIRNKQLSTLMVSLMMASYQKKLGENLGVSPGAELLAAAQAANDLDIPVSLCDRDIRITLRRAWKSTSFFKKAYLLSSLIAGLFESQEIDEQKLEELKKQDVLAELMAEMGDSLPDMKKVLIDERDVYLAEKIKETAGEKLVAVVGAGHVQGIKRHFSARQSSSVERNHYHTPSFKRVENCRMDHSVGHYQLYRSHRLSERGRHCRGKCTLLDHGERYPCFNRRCTRFCPSGNHRQRLCCSTDNQSHPGNRSRLCYRFCTGDDTAACRSRV